jgi:hypothetical protein
MNENAAIIHFTSYFYIPEAPGKNHVCGHAQCLSAEAGTLVLELERQPTAKSNG